MVQIVIETRTGVFKDSTPGQYILIYIIKAPLLITLIYVLKYFMNIYNAHNKLNTFIYYLTYLLISFYYRFINLFSFILYSVINIFNFRAFFFIFFYLF